MSQGRRREPSSGATAASGANSARPGPGAGNDGESGDVQDYAGTPRPDAIYPQLDAGQLAALREVGREWGRVSASPQAWREALPVDPSLGEYPDASEFRPARLTKFAPVAGLDGQLPPIVTTRAAEEPQTAAGRIGQDLRRLIAGPPLEASAIAFERMRKLVALPVLSADALSSVAYGPQAMLVFLVLAGLPGLSASLPVGGAIMFLMLAVGVSYRQTIRAYPQGGGSYIVATEELGRVAGLMAAGGLLIDYVMTVAVSIASGVAAITSALPSLQPQTTVIGVAVIVVLLAVNLRGVRQAGVVFAAPTYAFILSIALLVGGGLADEAGRGFHPVQPNTHLPVLQALTVLLVLRAFAAGATAMTGIEAISNAVPAFRPVEWRNARVTLSWMVGLLIAMFAGVLVITRLTGITPVASQTMLSQLAHLSYGSGPVYVFIQAATAAVLLLAANTAYNDFPRVLFLMARDRQAPRSFLQIGDRLTFRDGIVLLSVLAAVVYIAFSGNTSALLPLYAVGVFLAFTMSQTGMILHWRHHRDKPHWRKSMAFNATGAVLSGIVFVIEAVTKFTAGAWVAIVLIAAIIVTALRIHRYYAVTGQQLALQPEDVKVPLQRPAPDVPPPHAEHPERTRDLTVIPVVAMNRAALQALAHAAALGQPAFALHISPTAEEADRFAGYWQTWGDHLPLEVMVSPHRAVVAPLVNYIWTLHQQRPDLTLTVTVPEVVDRHWSHRILLDPVAPRLQRALHGLPGVIVTSVPFQVSD
jgi:amino acid transporter